MQWSDASRSNGNGVPSSPAGGPISNAERTEAHKMKSVASPKCRPGQILFKKERLTLVCGWR